MKTKFLLMMTFLAIAGMVSAQNALVVDDFTLPQSGGKIAVGLTLDEADVYTSYQFKIETPTGIAYVVDASDDVECELGDGHAASHNATAHWNSSERLLAVGVASMSSALLKGQNVVLQIPIDATTAEVGTVLSFTVIGITFIKQSGTKENLTDVTFNVTIGEPADTRTVLDENATVAPSAAAGVDVRVKRTIKADEWSTICLPFAMTTEQVKAAFGDDLKLGDFQGCEENGEKVNVKFAEATAIEANHPYIIKVSAPVSEFTVDGVDISPEDEPMIKKDKYKSKYNSFIGNYVNGTKVDDYGLYLMGGKFWYSKGNVNVKAFRGYFVFDTIDVDYDTARMDITFDDATGIKNVGHAANAEKYYDLSGRVVSKPGKGIYVRNGQKMVVK
ncbi:MAG: hypothetical protein IKR31_07385 [Prevotella sp.]|nr:hypothetical protein [Prevotella sp.]